MRLRRCVHRGSVLAAALHVRGRRRVLALWRPGCTVESAAGGHIVTFPEPRRLACARASGTPLVSLGGVLAGAPLLAEELTQLAPPPGSHVLCVGGEAQIVTAAERTSEDPSAWIDLGGFARPEAQTLGDPPPPIAVETAAPQPARARFSVPAPRAGVDDLVRAVMAAAAARADKQQQQEQGQHPYRTPPPSDAAFATRFGLGALALAGAVALVLVAPTLALPVAAAAALAAMAARGAGGAPRGSAERGAKRSGAPSKTLPPLPPPAPRGESAWNKLSRWLKRQTARGALGRALGRRHAQYLDELLELLDRGDTDEALRRAIPLGGPGGTPGAPAWAMPGRRESIRIQPIPAGGPRSSIFADDPILAALRQRYRALFERLEAQGKIDEAAFVLGELLGDWNEAVTYLERHGRHRLAAEVAEGHRLDAALVVHLWLKAGERARAVLLARTRHAFAAAVQRLEQRGTPEDRATALELRRLWAQQLADDGDLLGAVRAIEPVLGQLAPEPREQALDWLRRGAELDGPPGAALLAVALALDAADRAGWRARALALAADTDPERRATRFAFLRALVAQKADVTRVVSRAAARALIVEAETVPAAGKLALELARHASDPVLLADLPPMPAPVEPALAPPIRHAVEARDRGQLVAHDATWLADGRVLIALGEIGVRVRERKKAWLVPEPAHQLVVSPSGTRLLALAPRDGATRVARVDLGRRASSPWGELRLQAHGPFLLRGLWAVATGPNAAVSLLDVERERPTSVFQIGDLGGPVIALAHDEHGLAFVADRWLWRYDAGLVLRERADFAAPNDPDPTFAAVSGAGARAALGLPALRLSFAPAATAPFSTAHVADLPEAIALTMGADHVALARPAPGGLIVEAWAMNPLRLVLVLELHGANHARLRLLPGGERSTSLVTADDLGRVLIFDLASGALVRDLRT